LTRVNCFSIRLENMRTHLLIIGLLSLGQAAMAQSTPHLNLMPMPASVQLGPGQLPIDQSFSIAIASPRDGMVDRGVQRFVAQLSKQTGMLIPAASKSANSTLAIKVERAKTEVEKLGEDESYRLNVASSGATLSAPNSLGILNGLQTFLRWSSMTTRALPGGDC
jgi:hexosaminidase